MYYFVGIYGEIQPQPLGNPSGSGNISPYILSLVILQIQSVNQWSPLSFSNTFLRLE